MKRYFLITALLWAALGTGCTKDPETASPERVKGQVSLYITHPERPQVTTRANTPADETIDPQSVCVLLFSGNDDSSVLLDWGFAAPVDSESCYGIKLPEHTEACYAHIIANFRSGIEGIAAADGWTKNNTTLATVRQRLVTASLPVSSGAITAMPAIHPMAGGFDMPGGIRKSTTIGSSADPVILTPATVKLTVRNQVSSGSSYTFELQGATLCSAPDHGYVIPSAGISGIALLPYGPEGDVSRMMVATQTVEGVTATLPLYCYESAADNATSVIIKTLYNGCEGYYRLSLFNADKSALRDLVRGYHYKIVVRTVQTAGYRTAAEAMANPASNGIIYDIETEDPDSYDIITNGAQYLGVSNSEYWMYNSNYINAFENVYNDSEDITLATPFTVTVLTYTANRTWLPGEVTASEGIHLQAEDGTHVSGLTLPLPATEGASVRRELKAFFDDNFTEGTLDIRIGDLHKTVKVKRAHSASILGEVFPLGKDVIYASLKSVDNSSGPTKTDPTAYGLSYDQNVFCLTGNVAGELDPDKELYLRVIKRFPDMTADYCYATIYLHRNTAAGRVKVDLATDMNGQGFAGDNNYNPMFNILGAFWKNDERGERLVQIPQCSYIYNNSPLPLYGRWVAKVIAGQDFIRLEEWDEGLTMTNGVFDGDPEGRLIEGNKQDIAGKDFMVRFRIGLTSTNKGNPNRYGLIQLIYQEKRPGGSSWYDYKISNFIFVRQGEAPDNLLTPGQTYYSAKDGSTTVVAPDVKFSPYELIDPQEGTGGDNVTDHTLLADGERAVLAPYPTWYGYEFQWGQGRAYHPGPYNKNNALTGWISSVTDADKLPTEYREVCPEGYITPPTQIDGTDIHWGICCVYPGGPQYTTYTNLNTGAHPGIYLDGYQDRRIEVTNGDIPDTYENVWDIVAYNHAIEKTYAHYTEATSEGDILKNKMFSLGYLAFNPETMASLYFPIVLGGRAAWDGNIWDDYASGRYLLYWTQTVDAVTPQNGYSMALYDRRTSSLNKAYGLRVRCIKDTNKP